MAVRGRAGRSPVEIQPDFRPARGLVFSGSETFFYLLSSLAEAFRFVDMFLPGCRVVRKRFKTGQSADSAVPKSDTHSENERDIAI